MFKKVGSIICATMMFFEFGIYAMAKRGEYEFVNEAERNLVENVLLSTQYNKKYETDVFEGHATYLLDDSFLECYDENIGAQRPAGWDLDYRGGIMNITSKTDRSERSLADGSLSLPSKITHGLMTHRNGELVLETSFQVFSGSTDGLFFELSGEDKKVIRIETIEDGIYALKSDGKHVLIKQYKLENTYKIKAMVDMEKKSIKIYLNGVFEKELPFYEDASCIDEICIGTEDHSNIEVRLDFVQVYINYLVNEKFMSTPVGGTPGDWYADESANAANNGVCELFSQGYPDNTSYRMSVSSVVARPTLSKAFNSGDSDIEAEFNILIPKKQNNKKNSIEVQLAQGKTAILSIKPNNDHIMVNNTVVYEDYYENCWYHFKVVTDYAKNNCDVYINYNLVAEDVPLLANKKADEIKFMVQSDINNEMIIDDIAVVKHLPLYKDYPEEPRTVKSDTHSIGIIMYSMWREGYHFGWDRLSPYEERTPYMGYYTEGSTEVADWEIKWLKEHGVDFQIYPFTGVISENPAPIKRTIRSQAFYDGFLNAEYDMDFCLLWSNPTEQTIQGLDHFKDYILPHWIEYYFKNPNYKTVDNKAIVYSYNTKKIADLLGGMDNFNIALGLLDEECKKLGYDGVIFVSDLSAATASDVAMQANTWVYWYAQGEIADNKDGVISRINKTMDENSYAGIIPSVCQGCDTTPWRTSTVGFMTPQDIRDMLVNIKENTSKWKEKGNRGADIITLTCWNEWGEGHFFAPSTLYGFENMNAVRDVMTSAGVLADEAIPTEDSIARMGVLYPITRQSLKLMPDKVDTYEDVEGLTLMKKWDFGNPEDFAALEIEKNVQNLRIENGCAVAEPTATDPSIYLNDVNLTAKDIQVIKVNAYQPDEGSFTIYYQTTVDTNIGKNKKLFVAPLSSTDLTDIYLIPSNRKKLEGVLTRMRLDPDDGTSGEFKIKSVEIYGKENNEVNITIDGTDYYPTTPLVNKDGVVYMSMYKFLYGEKHYAVTWDKPTRAFAFETKDKDIFEFKADSTEYIKNGIKYNLTSAPFYDDGNFYMPVRETFSLLGYAVGWDSEKSAVALTSPEKQNAEKRGEITNLVWEFDADGSLDGWLTSAVRAYSVKDGVLMLSPRNKNCIVQINDIDIDASNNKYLIIRMKNGTPGSQGRVFIKNNSITNYGSANMARFQTVANDSGFTTYTIDLSTIAGWDGTLKGLRIDPALDHGIVEIDYIKLSDREDV